MKLEEAINKLEELSQYESVVENHEEAILTVLQELEHLQFEMDLARKRIEGELEVLEKYSLNKWENHFGFEEETVAVKRIRNITSGLKDLLKEE